MATEWEHIIRSSAGIDWSMRVNDEGQTQFLMSQDIEAALEYNKNCYNWNDGYSDSRDIRRAASIPLIIIYKWQTEEGWNALDAGSDPDVAKKLMQKLNDPDYAFLRTAPGRLSANQGSMF